MLWFGSYYTAKFEKLLFLPQEGGGGSVQQLPLTTSVDSTHQNHHERWPAAMLTCPANNICFSLRFKEKRAARHVQKSLFFLPQEGGGGAPQEVLRLKKSACMCSRRLVEEPSPSTVWLQQLGCFFLSRKEKFHCAHGARHAIARAA